jgi:hypothetical protein
LKIIFKGVIILPKEKKSMLLILKDLKSYLRSLFLSFWLVQNLSSLTEGFPTSGNDNHWNRVRHE